MTDAARDDLSQAAKKLAAAVQGGNAAAARALTIAEVAAHFDPIANTIQQLAPKIAGATITIDSLYGLDASDLKAAQQTQFFCASSNAALHVEVSISQLPPGKYALALVHATGVQQPQQMAFSADEQWLVLAVGRLLLAASADRGPRQRVVLDAGAGIHPEAPAMERIFLFDNGRLPLLSGRFSEQP